MHQIMSQHPLQGDIKEEVVTPERLFIPKRVHYTLWQLKQHVPRVRSPPGRPPRNRFWTEVRGYAEALVVVAFLIVTFVFTTVGVVGSSMRPNLNGGNGTAAPVALYRGPRLHP